MSDLFCIMNFRFNEHVHGDIDNLAKSVLDGMQKVAFKNDKQILKLDTEIFFDTEKPGCIEVILMRHRPRNWEDRLTLDTIQFLSEWRK